MERDIFTEISNPILKNIEFNHMDIGQKLEDFDVKDELTSERRENDVLVTVKRKCKFVPEKVFCLEVSYSIILTLNNEISDITDEEISIEIEENKDNITNNIMGKISYMMSQIMNEIFQVPIITPPILLTKDND